MKVNINNLYQLVIDLNEHELKQFLTILQIASAQCDAFSASEACLAEKLYAELVTKGNL